MRQFLLLTTIFFALQNAAAQDIFIKNVHIIPMTNNKVLEHQSLLIRDGKIIEIGDHTKLKSPPQTKIIDGNGRFLMPGLADMHVHLPSAEMIDNCLLLNVAAGVTHIRVMNSKTYQPDIAARVKKDKEMIRPDIHFSLVLSRSVIYTPMQYDSLFSAMENNGLSFVKLFSLPDSITFEHIMASAEKNNITVCGHYPGYVVEGKWKNLPLAKVLKSGFKSIEHLGGYDLADTESEIDQAVKLSKENEVYNCPTIDWDVIAADLEYPEKYKERITYTSLPDHVINKWEASYGEAIEKAGGRDSVIHMANKYRPKYLAKHRLLKKLSDSGALLLMGADAGNDFQLDGFNIYEEMHAWSKAGIDNYSILKSATVNPARFYKESDIWGTIEVGKKADLVFLEKNPLIDIKNIASIYSTVINGKVYSKKDLMKRAGF